LDTPQFVCESYDHIEILQFVPHVTRVSLLGGACLCCARNFKARPPQDMPKGSLFGPNLRALIIYLHLPALHPRHRLRAPCYSPVRSPRSRHQRRRARQNPRRGAGLFHGGDRRDPHPGCSAERSRNPTRPVCGSARETGG
jgi:transposase